MRLSKFRCKNKAGNWCFFTVLHNGNVNEENFYLETLSEFTGLLDKQGVEIYEGDIYSTGDMKILKVVQWHDTGFKGKQIGTFGSYEGLTYFQQWIEVIGNIYENPELLEK